jgi:NAD+ synthase
MKQINTEQTIQEIEGFLKEVFTKTGFTNTVVGLSGGVDSAVSCALAVRALGAYHIFPYLLPYGALNTQGVLDAMEVIECLKIPINNVQRIDIRPLCDQIISREFGMESVRRGNIMARMRMILLFDAAKKHKALVLGTENKSEHMLGYYTRFGDQASDIEPLARIYKTGVYDLAKALHIPQAIISKAPSAGLWDAQTDETDFGFTYAQADEVLEGLYEKKMSKEELAGLGIDAKVIEKVERYVNKNAFKQSLPYIPRTK